MEIRHMNKMLQNAKHGEFPCEGMTIEEIIALEKNSGGKFPLAFKEFLLIGGRYDNTGTNNFDFVKLQKLAHENLAYTGNKIERPFFVFNGIDACSVFDFIYLDEVEDNPQVYVASPSYTEFGDSLIEIHPHRFVQIVERNIEQANEDE